MPKRPIYCKDMIYVGHDETPYAVFCELEKVNGIRHNIHFTTIQGSVFKNGRWQFRDVKVTWEDPE